MNGWLQRRDDEYRRAQESAANLLSGLEQDNPDRFLSALGTLLSSQADVLPWALKRVVASGLDAGPKVRLGFLARFVHDGDNLRNMTDDDRLTLRILRRLLPSYTGRARTLFRGEFAMNRKHRRYGWSWTASREVADVFAQKYHQAGSVILRTVAPREAIICRPSDHLPDYLGENEFILDRTKLRVVEVLDRLVASPFSALTDFEIREVDQSADSRDEQTVLAGPRATRP